MVAPTPEGSIAIVFEFRGSRYRQGQDTLRRMPALRLLRDPVRHLRLALSTVGRRGYGVFLVWAQFSPKSFAATSACIGSRAPL